jgi:hypothetical protein
LSNINEDVDIFKVRESDMPFEANLQVVRLAYLGPKSKPSQGNPFGGLGYEYKCWARFNSWFDMPDDSWRCKQ